ncbi:MAG: M24 family metallopeptidase [Firmicutes bacterium]|nr:M24 family metallopeptidase [Bacillota bacterium]
MKKELSALRDLMAIRGIDCYLVTTGDFHCSEYIHDYFKTRRYVSGFTGSAGILMVTADDARLWTDSRYFIQAARQIAGSGISLMKQGEDQDLKDFLKEHLQAGQTFGFDGRILAADDGEDYEKIAREAGATLVYDVDLAGEIWMDRPALTGAPIWKMPDSSTGCSYSQKIAEVRRQMAERGVTHHLITDLMENAYLYNLRGDDVLDTPVFFSFTLITPDSVFLYMFDEAFAGNDPAEFIPCGVQLRDYHAVAHDLAELPQDAVVLADKHSVSYALLRAIPATCQIVDERSPLAFMKAVKNETEIKATEYAHLVDGVAMVEFISWLQREVAARAEKGLAPLTEITAADYLDARRADQEGFLELSFDTISAYGENGALPHYSAVAGSEATICPEGFLLVDSGGQYYTGTTDITRTIAVGPLTEKMKSHYTAVLKAHITLALARFADGTTGKELDELTRRPMQAVGLDFGHGTGHGVGHVLSVHEGPQSISKRGDKVKFLPGMITSNEPGVYLEGEFGVRIENEILCVADADGMLSFRNLTLCPYEREAIVTEDLTPTERAYVDQYHAWVYESLTGKLTPEAEAWLAKACQPL